MDHEQPRVKQTDEKPEAPKKKEQQNRFRLEKLEERIAPAAHYNPHTKWVGTGNGNGGDSSISGSY